MFSHIKTVILGPFLCLEIKNIIPLSFPIHVQVELLPYSIEPMHDIHSLVQGTIKKGIPDFTTQPFSGKAESKHSKTLVEYLLVNLSNLKLGPMCSTIHIFYFDYILFINVL
ncbi:unnamed protein product [Cuscuta epithymum]|uniref:Uncharacterized protein n=1 Tax=Cuscuta epithymum TaxID=186058 RepID=A0AAV0ENA2_9ASTE|nr:unnamed protein product [Cuscuta epithymum]